MSPLLVLGCLAIAALAVLISARFFGHPFSPFSVFYGAWFGALGLYNLNWISYTPVRGPAWTLIALSLLSFGVGWLIPYLRWDSRDIQPPELVVQQVSAERLRIAIFVCFVLGVIGTVAFLAAVRSTVGLAAFIEAPGEVRTAMAKGGGLEEPLKIFDWLHVAIVVFCSFYLFAMKSRRSRWVWPVLAFSLSALFLMEDRTHFFYAACWAGFVLLHSMRITAKKIVVLMAVAAGLLLSQFLLVAVWLGKVAENNPALVASANVQDAMIFILSPYMYITESFPSLQVYMDSAPASTHGSMTFYPVFRMINFVDPTLEPPAIVAEPVDIPSESNTFTWLHQFYTDFGTAGAILGPWFIGVLTSAVYFHMLRARTFYSTLMNGLFLYCLGLSIFVNLFTQGPAWYFAAVGLVISAWVKLPALGLRTAEV